MAGVLQGFRSIPGLIFGKEGVPRRGLELTIYLFDM